MKSQIKRFSKSTLSVVLAFCMLVSCMTVGLIATDAAYDDSTPLGGWEWDATFKMGSNVSGGWDSAGQAATHTSGNRYVYYDYYFTHNDTHSDGEVRFAFYQDGSWDSRIVPTTNKTSIDGSSNKKNCTYGNSNNRSDWYWVYNPSWLADDGKYYKVTMTLDMQDNSNDGKMWYTTTALTSFSPTLTVPATGTVGTAITLSGNCTETGKVGTLTKTYQYSTDNGSTWNDLSNASYTATSGGDVKFRYKVADSGVVSSGANALSDRIEYSTVQTCSFENIYSVAGEERLTGYNWSTSTNDMTKSGSSYTKTFNNIAAGTYKFKIAKNHTWDGAIGYSDSVNRDGLVTNVSSGENSNIVFTTSDSANVTITYTPESSILINAVSNKIKLQAPTGLSFSPTSPVTASTSGSITLSWTAESNAGSYEIYKDTGTTPIATVSGTSYSIDKKYSSGGTYYVVALPSNSSTHTKSDKSTGISLTVNRISAPATPSISIDKTDIGSGDSATITVSNAATFATNYTLKLYKDNVEQSNVISNGTFTVSATGDYKVKAVANNSEYYDDSSFSSTVTLNVHTPTWYLTGDLVRGNPGTSDAWKVNDTTYAVNVYDSGNVFCYSITTTTDGNHYFRLYKAVNGSQYGPSDSQDKDMANYDGSTSNKKLTASGTTGTGAMYVSGRRSFKIYVDQTEAENPVVWVVATSAETKTTTIYVNKDSGATNLYLWSTDSSGNKTVDINTWTGESLSTEETINDIKYYKVEFDSNQPYFRGIPNKNSNTQQSANSDVKPIGSTYYMIWDGTNGHPVTMTDAAPNIQLGYKVQNTSSVSYEDFASRSVSVNLAANTTYEFWLKSANSHLNDENAGTMTRANCTSWHFPVKSENTKIQADLAGTYTFTYTVTNGEIYVSVTYPPEPKYDVTINQGDHGTLVVDGSAVSGSSIVVQLGEITKAIVEAFADEGYHFKEWTTTGGVAAESGFTTSSNPIKIGASANGTLTATYEENSYTLTLASAGNGSITTPSSKTLTVHPITATSLSGVTVTPANGYKFNGWTLGTDVTLTDGSTTNPSEGTVTATQNSTLTAKFTKVSYTLTGKTSLNGTEGDYGTVTFYSNEACTNQIYTAQIGNTVYAKFTSNDYALVSFDRSPKDASGGTGGTTTDNVYSFTMGYANTTVTAAVRQLTSVTYYVDMHDNSVSTMSIAVVQNMGGTPVKDGKGNDCSATLGDTSGDYRLTKQGDSTVYAASINTPNPTGDLYVKITFNGRSKVVNLDSTLVSTLLTKREMWLEAENEASTPLTVNYSTRSTPTVPEGSRRIYLARPYKWYYTEGNEEKGTNTEWNQIGIYHWGNYPDIGWNECTKMNKLGYSGTGENDYYYYYVDIPKAINGNKVSNIIFQGWGSNQEAGTYSKAQTDNIENIPDSANFYILSKDGNAFVGTKSEEDAVIANYTRYVSSVEMNKTESTEVNISPTYTGGLVTYTPKVVGTQGQSDYINHGDYVTVDRNGVIHPVKSTIGLPDDCAEIIVKVYSTIGRTIYEGSGTDAGDCLTYTVRVNIHDPSQFNGFEIMSLESETYTISIPSIESDQPGCFDFSNDDMVFTVTGLKGVNKSTNSAIIFDISTGAQPNSFKIKYAKANTVFSGYSGIRVVGDIVTKSILNTSSGKRYGLDFWKKYTGSTAANPNPNYTTSKTIENGVETVVTKGIIFGKDDSDNNVYNRFEAIFAKYDYVDVTFTFNYDEYVPKVVDGMIQYPYDADWAAQSGSHTTKTVKVSNFEIRKLVKSDIIDKTSESIVPEKLTLLVNGAAQAMGVMPESNYYNYKIDADTIPLDKISKVEDENQVENPYAVNVTVNMSHSVKQYKVYVNGDQIKDSNNNPLTYTYQQYAEPTVENACNWYAVDSSDQNASIENAPLLATNVNSYKFRVKGSDTSNNTYLITAAATNPHGNDFLRSEVDFSHYEVTHQGSSPTSMKEYLMQNFYIADFFSPAEVLNPKSYTGKGKIGEAYKVEKVESSTPSSSANITVYFTNTLDWNDVKIYYWGDNIDVKWPGDAMTPSEPDGDGKSVYSASIPENVKGIIFTGSEKQTVDITQDIANGSHWKSKNEIVRNGIPYDDAQFVGGGVVYYSMNGATENNQGTPFANAVSSGYVNGSDGKINANAIKEMLKSNIEAQYAKDNIAGTVGEEDAMKAAYGTEIAATKNVEGGFNTGIIYRYLPLNQYKRDDSGNLVTDGDGKYTLAYDVNNNTFRYSNSLQSYQYVYASGNENKETNKGRNMRLYSYYVYSYVTYDQETNVPVTKYEIVLSDNYSDASTYWEGNPNPDPSN